MYKEGAMNFWHPKIKIYIFLWFGSTVALSCKPILMLFIEISSEFSGLPGYQLTFLIFAQGLKKTHMNWQQGIRISIGYQKRPFWGIFLKSLGKNRKKWADNPVALRILNQLQQTASKSVYNSGLQYFRTTKNSKTGFWGFFVLVPGQKSKKVSQ